MATDPQLPDRKPYDIRKRLFLFACDVARVENLQRDRGVATALSEQLEAAAVSAAANAEEADDGSSRRDFVAKERIVLRELKETRLRLRVLRETGVVGESGDRYSRKLMNW